jgi:hypothetical protein
MTNIKRVFKVVGTREVFVSRCSIDYFKLYVICGFKSGKIVSLLMTGEKDCLEEVIMSGCLKFYIIILEGRVV